MQGAHPKKVQELLGHSTIALTMDTYSHVLPAMHDELAQQMDALLAGEGISEGIRIGSRGHNGQRRARTLKNPKKNGHNGQRRLKKQGYPLPSDQ